MFCCNHLTTLASSSNLKGRNNCDIECYPNLVFDQSLCSEEFFHLRYEPLKCTELITSKVSKTLDIRQRAWSLLGTALSKSSTTNSFVSVLINGSNYWLSCLGKSYSLSTKKLNQDQGTEQPQTTMKVQILFRTELFCIISNQAIVHDSHISNSL